MATIVQIQNADGSISYRATIRKKRNGKVILNRSKTFTKRKLAETWATRMEAELQSDQAVDKAVATLKHGNLTLGDVIQKHIEFFHPLKKFGETKLSCLRVMSRASFASVPLNELRSADLLAWFHERKVSGGLSGGTLKQYHGYLKQVFTLAKPTFGIDLSVSLLEAIEPTLKAGDIIAKGGERSRRLQDGEYRILLAWFRKYDRERAKTRRMAELFRFLVRVPLRLGEACRISWDDVNHSKRTVMIRDRKDPQEKLGNDQEVPILGRAWQIIQALPRDPNDPRIFPYDEHNMSGLFTYGVAICGIEDLHLHDLRHESTSRMFEQGYQVQEVAIVTGHRSWDMLRRYTQIKPESLHSRAHFRHRPGGQADLPSTAVLLATVGKLLAQMGKLPADDASPRAVLNVLAREYGI